MHWHHQSNPRLLAGARHRSTAGATLLANRIATHSRHAARRALTPHGARHRRSGYQRIEELSSEIEELANRDPACVRLMSVPGIGPIISSAMVAAIGTGDGFSKGRDFAAWLGLVPKQISTGDRTILGSIVRASSRPADRRSRKCQTGQPQHQQTVPRPAAGRTDTRRAFAPACWVAVHSRWPAFPRRQLHSAAAFEFVERTRIGDHRAQLRFGGGAVIVGTVGYDRRQTNCLERLI